MGMKTNTDLTRQNTIDLSEELIVANPVFTPLTSLLLAKESPAKANDVVVRKKIKTLSTVASGARKEGAAAPDTEKTSYEWVNNNLEIFSKAVTISGTVSALEGGTKRALAKEIGDRLIEIKGDIEKSFFNGIKADETSSVGRKMAGLIKQAQSKNKIEITDELFSKKHINTAMRYLYEGQIDGERYLFVNPATVDRVTDLYTNTENAVVSLNVSGAEVGIEVVRVVTNFGRANIVLANAVPADKLVVASLDYTEVQELRAPSYEALAKTGDAEKGQVVSELTIITAPHSVAIIELPEEVEED